MTARDTIATAMAVPFYGRPLRALDTHSRAQLYAHVEQVVMASIRGMPHDELTELRPDIATDFYILKEQAAQRGQYLLTTLRAHQAAQQEGPT